MTVILLLCLLAAASGVLWGTHRHREVLAWERELDAAFRPGDRKEMSRRRIF